MKIRTEITLVIAAVFTAIIGSQFLLAKLIRDNQEGVVNSYESIQHTLSIVYELETAYQLRLDSWKSVLLRGHLENKYHFYLQRFYHHERLVKQLIEQLQQGQQYGAGFSKQLEKLALDFKADGKAHRKALKLFIDSVDTPHLVADQFADQEKLLRQDIQQIRQLFLEHQTNTLSQHNSATAEKESYLTWLTVIISIIASFVLLYLARTRIYQPIESALEIVEQVDEDAHSLRMPVTGNNEFAEYARAFNQMMEILNQQSNQLDQASRQLLQSEKMAALGGLVAGVAHELNTPLGIGLTAASSINHSAKELKRQFDNDDLKRSQMEQFFDKCINGCEVLEKNIYRASELIRHFKQVAVDQSSERYRQFSLKDTVEDVIFTLQPRMKRSQHLLKFDLADIEMHSYPGPIAQVLTNLVENSLLHGFKQSDQGVIEITTRLQDGQAILEYRDSGCGMSQDVQSKIFDPFFTTRGETGGSGLGMHIVYNLVTNILGGHIELDSIEGKYSRFIITLPINANATQIK